MVPFLSSKYHSKQTDAHPSVIKTFVEAFSLCPVPTYIKPQILRVSERNEIFSLNFFEIFLRF